MSLECSRGGNLLLLGHILEPQRAHSGAGGHILERFCSRGGELLPPGHVLVPQCAHSGIGGHISE